MGGKNLWRKTAVWIGCFAASLVCSAVHAQEIAADQGSEEVTADLLAEGEASEDEGVFPAAMFQPAPGRGMPSLSTGRSGGSSPARSSARPSTNRLASAPEMFGDFFMSGGSFTFDRNINSPGFPPTVGSVTVPPAGGGRNYKISENNKAMPADRVIFSYNHFNNALQFREAPFGNPAGGVARDYPIDRYTAGLEKTFIEGLWSVEVRMPFQGDFNFDSPSLTGTGGNVGNLAVIVKHLLVEDDNFSVVVGLGIDTPTGSDFTLIDRTSAGGPTRFTFHNDALHLMPYAGFLLSLEEADYYVSGFIQVDVAANGNRLDAGPGAAPAQPTIGTFTEQNLLFLDLGGGYFLYQSDLEESRLTSLAAILEFHYTTSLQDTDVIAATVGGRPFNYSNQFNRFDITNITAGFQAVLYEQTSLRVAGVFPLGSRDDQRFFDSEVQVQVNRRF